MQAEEILVRNNLFGPVPKGQNEKQQNEAVIGTLVSNFLYFGFAPNQNLIEHFYYLNNEEIESVWHQAYSVFSKITGAQYSIGSHVLYKNFPKEVLDMSEAEYWIRQLFVYLGAPYESVTQKEEERESILNEISPNVISCVLEGKEFESSINMIIKTLVYMNVRWTDEQFNMVESIINNNPEHMTSCQNITDFGFKDNAIELWVNYYNDHFYNPHVEQQKSMSEENLKNLQAFKSLLKQPAKSNFFDAMTVVDATDVLRIASGLSGKQLRDMGNGHSFRKFTRSERKSLLRMLENSNNLESDVATQQEVFKKLFRRLRSGDYKNSFPKVCDVYDKVYNKRLMSYNAQLEKAFNELNDKEAFYLLSQKPGVFIRRFHKAYEIFGQKAVNEIQKHLQSFSILQLLKFKNYIETVNDRDYFVIAPNGRWKNSIINPNNKCKIDFNSIKELRFNIEKIINLRIRNQYPDGFKVDEKLKQAKIQGNNQSIASYGIGTVFDIPENIKFIRTSSYWDIEQISFLDNTWNFYNEQWESVGVCCWNREKAGEHNDFYSVFSGDAVNRREGKAAQLIDLYLDKLQEQGVRYAVWSILSYNAIPYEQFKNAHAGMQMGENPEKGKLFEPSRVQFSFELTEDELTKIVAYVDVKKRHIVFCDVNKRLKIETGDNNKDILKEFMPAYIDNLQSIPSYWDLLRGVNTPQGEPALFEDGEALPDSVRKAFIFRPKNPDNQNIDMINLQSLITS